MGDHHAANHGDYIGKDKVVGAHEEARREEEGNELGIGAVEGVEHVGR